jgi:hypothetical protein
MEVEKKEKGERQYHSPLFIVTLDTHVRQQQQQERSQQHDNKNANANVTT